MSEPEIKKLVARLESTQGPDRDLDAALHVALIKPEQREGDLRYLRVPSPSMDHMEMCAPGTYWLKERSGASLHTSPKYTASLDAALELAERTKPDLFPSIAQWQGEWRAELRGSGVRAHGRARQPAIALCLALLSATLAQANVPPQASATEGKVMLTLTWKDETEIDFDHTVVFGHGYDFDGFELFRQEAQTLHGRFAMWPEMDGPHRATFWSVYDATDGDLQLGKFASDVEADAYAYAKAAARANLSPPDKAETEQTP